MLLKLKVTDPRTTTVVQARVQSEPTGFAVGAYHLSGEQWHALLERRAIETQSPVTQRPVTLQLFGRVQ